MPFFKVYTHFVWTTKNREPFLSTPELRSLVWNHIRENSFSKGIFIDHINGYSDHCHCLVSLSTLMPVAQILNLIKGESSYWINKNGLCNKKFKWQNDYWGVSVGIKELERIRKYIRNQEQHHRMKSFQDECKDEDIVFEDENFE